ncbi:hypothetical protein OF83DRAFT_1148149 [Amylostereum chailletii]|nr:hypothetical protein OF83DRAFT_1148149 [Amylostereum chailletii]
MQRFSQTTNVYDNTDFVDSGGRPVLRVSTPNRMFGTITTKFERATTDASRRAVWTFVAEIEYHWLRRTRFRFRGKDLAFDKYMVRTGPSGGKWSFVAGSGREFTWSPTSTTYLVCPSPVPPNTVPSLMART